MKKVNLNEVKNKILPMFLLILLLVGGSYAWFNYVKVGDKTQVVRAGKYSFKLEECENDIILKNAVPESAKKGLEEDVCTFRVQNTGSVSGEYTVYLDDEELEEKEKRMNDSFVRYSLVKGDEEESEEKTKLLTTTGTNPERVMATGTLNKGEEDVYHLKVWIDSEATNEVMSTIFYGKLRVKIDQTTKQTVTINPNGGVYNKKKENTVIAKKTGETVEIVEEPQREGYEFVGWEIEEGTVITGNIITVGKKNITLKAKWNVSKDAVARINDNYYTSLEKALEAAKETGDTIVMVKDTSESVVNQKDVTLDLENHTVTSKEEQTIINNGTLRIIKSGTIGNTNKKVIVNNGVLILGEDDSEVSQKNPYIKGSELGIEQKGTMKFYDGLVEAKVGITGEVNEVAEGHYVFVDHDDQTGNQKVYLVETLTKAVVKTNGTIPIYYFNLQDAINTTTITQEKIEAIRNFEAAYALVVKADTNIVIDIKGYTVETGNKITNEGNLTIKDTESEKGVLKPSVSITNNGKLIFEGIAVEETTDVNVVENSGNLEINSSTITANGGYAVDDKGILLMNKEATLKSNSNYAVYYNKADSITLENGNIQGLYIDNSDAVVTINSGNYSNISDKKAIYFNGKNFTINGGSYTSKKANAVESAGGTIEINGGEYKSEESQGICLGGSSVINNATVTGKNGIETTGTMTINNATVTVTENALYNYGTNLTINEGNYNGKMAIGQNRGTTNVYGGTYEGTEYGIGGRKNGLWDDPRGTVNIGQDDKNNEITITGKEAGVDFSEYYHQVTTNIYKGTITGGTGVKDKDYLSVYGGTIVGTNGPGIDAGGKIYGGKITGTTYGINATTTTVIGKEQEEVNIISPEIIGEMYGLYINGGNVSLYGGIYKGKTGGYNGGTISSMPDGYSVLESTEEINGDIYLTNYLGTKKNFLRVGEKGYNSFSKAIESIDEEGTIEVTASTEISTDIEIPADKKITIELLGNTLSMSQKITNNGELVIKDSSEDKTGTITNSLTDQSAYGIVSNKKITLESGNVVTTSNASSVYISGEGILNDVKISSNQKSVYLNSGTLTINGGSYTSKKANAVESAGGTIEINGGEYKSEESQGICLGGSSVINNATVTGKNGIETTGTMTINNATVTVTENALYNYGTNLTINEGNYNGKMAIGHNRGTTNVYGGTYEGTEYGIGGRKNGLWDDPSGTVNIGQDDEIINDKPIIKAKTYAITRGNDNSTVYNFYDGVLKGQTGASSSDFKSIAKNSSMIDSEETIDDVMYQTIYLIDSPEVATNNGKNYTSLNDAIKESNNGDTITIINDVSEFNAINIESDKNITIDMVGYTLKAVNGITNEGTLTIRNSNETEKSKIKTNSAVLLIQNKGMLSIENAILENTNTAQYIIKNFEGATLTTSNVDVNGNYGITNASNIELNDTNITISKDDGYALYNDNQKDYTVNLNGGTYTSESNNIAIYNNGITTTEMTISNITIVGNVSNNVSKLTLNNSTVSRTHGNAGVTAVNNSSGVLNIESSEIRSKSTYNTYWAHSEVNCVYSENGDLIMKSVGLESFGTKGSDQTFNGIKLNLTSKVDNTILIDDVTTNFDNKGVDVNSLYISGGDNNSNIQIKNINFNIASANTGYGIYETSTSNDFNVNLISGNIYTNATTAYGVYVDSGSLTMGIKDGDGSENATVDKENPFVKAVGTTGVGVKKNNGYFKYYDGKIMGSTNAKPDTTTDTEYNYEAVMHTDQETGYEYCVLEYMK